MPDFTVAPGETIILNVTGVAAAPNAAAANAAAANAAAANAAAGNADSLSSNNSDFGGGGLRRNRNRKNKTNRRNRKN